MKKHGPPEEHEDETKKNEEYERNLHGEDDKDHRRGGHCHGSKKEERWQTWW